MTLEMTCVVQADQEYSHVQAQDGVDELDPAGVLGLGFVVLVVRSYKTSFLSY